MHISTHNDMIWNGAQEREDTVRDILRDTFPDSFVKLVDAVWPSEEAQYQQVFTDTVFLYETKAEIVSLIPELWGHIFHVRELMSNQTPTKRLNCLMNRIAGDRYDLFCHLHNRNLIEDNYVSFNCRVPMIDPSSESRQQAFDDIHNQTQWDHCQAAYQFWRDRMPLTLEVNDPDFVALDSEVTIVSETYASEFTIGLSEKIFRALQMPRPWLLNCSPGSVALLRDNGFDVLDDIVDHEAYDHLHNDRITTMLDVLPGIVYDPKRCERAALHNFNRLHELNSLWDDRFKKVLLDGK